MRVFSHIWGVYLEWAPRDEVEQIAALSDDEMRAAIVEGLRAASPATIRGLAAVELVKRKIEAR